MPGTSIIVQQQVEEEVEVHEAGSGLGSLQKEDIGWRRAGGGSNVDGTIEPWNHATHQKVALRIFQQHHMGRRLLTLIADFVIGDGISVQAKHDDEGIKQQVQDAIDEFWVDPINDMDRRNEQRCIEWNLWGEICMPIKRNDATGGLRVGWINPQNIENVIPHPITGLPHLVVLHDHAAKLVGMKELVVASYDIEEEAILGDCFYGEINTVIGGGRGVSELYTAGDWLDVLDNTLKAHADRGKIDSYFIWDVTLTGMSDEEVVDWIETHGKKKPKPNSIRAHNEKVEWKAVSPALGSADMSEHIRTIKSYIMGGCGLPNHWFGSGDDANLATATAMGEPTRKNLKRKQKQFKFLLTDMIRHLLYSKIAAGQITGLNMDEGDPFEVQIPDLSGPDIAKVGSAMVQIGQAIAAAEEAGYVSHDTAVELFATIAAETGLEIDAAMELSKVEAESAEREKKEAAEAEKAEQELQNQLKVAAANPAPPAPAVPQKPVEGK